MQSQKEAIRVQPIDIVVIGGSAGSIEALKLIVSGLPAGFPGSVFIAIHVPADSPTMLAALLSRQGPLPTTNPVDREPIRHGRIYVCRPDHHLTIEDGRVRVLRGPRENRHRPAIDPLFRTAARAYGRRVAGIVLSGLLDDGSAGLYAIKQRGGVAIVQDPGEAGYKDMPNHAIQYVHPQYIAAAREIAPLLVEFAKVQKSEPAMAKKSSVSRKSKANSGGRIHREGISPKPDMNKDVAFPEEGEGTPSVFACPECHGVLWELKNDEMVRFRCRVGHSYGTESLNAELSVASEDALWAAVRALEEKSALQRRFAEAPAQDPRMASRLLDQSVADADNARLIRDMIFPRDLAVVREEEHSKKRATLLAKKTA